MCHGTVGLEDVRHMTFRPFSTFGEAYACLLARGPAKVVSSRGTPYSVTAEREPTGRRVIIARPGGGQVRIHGDCWGEDITCHRTRAGGVYNGSPSIWDWLQRC